MDIPLTIAIPTYQREEVLLDTLRQLLQLKPPPSEILVLDQTKDHEPSTTREMKNLSAEGKVVWIRLTQPSTTHAMNVGLEQARYDVVLFVDDDIIPEQGLISAHIDNYKDTEIWAVAGQVLQPGESPYTGAVQCRTTGLRSYLDFPFNSSFNTWIENGIACNLSVRREKALVVGGFDENFVGVAYRFETEFCRRLCKAGGKVLFEPRASIRHLKAERGGTRSSGSHLTSHSPKHGVGDYYFVLCQGFNLESLAYICKRPFREVSTRFHLKHPWWIPVKFFGEIRAMIQAFHLYHQGPKLLDKQKLTDI